MLRWPMSLDLGAGRFTALCVEAGLRWVRVAATAGIVSARAIELKRASLPSRIVDTDLMHRFDESLVRRETGFSPINFISLYRLFMRLQYTNGVVAAGWLDGEAFGVACLGFSGFFFAVFGRRVGFQRREEIY